MKSKEQVDNCIYRNVNRNRFPLPISGFRRLQKLNNQPRHFSPIESAKLFKPVNYTFQKLNRKLIINVSSPPKINYNDIFIISTGIFIINAWGY